MSLSSCPNESRPASGGTTAFRLIGASWASRDLTLVTLTDYSWPVNRMGYKFSYFQWSGDMELMSAKKWIRPERQSTAFEIKAKQVMKDAGLTYQQVGEKMGYPPEAARQMVYKIIHGRNPSIHKLVTFAKAVGVQVEDLL
jgi:hypothetical protein